MEAREYRLMYEQEDRHWWFRSRCRMTQSLLEKHILRACRTQKPWLLDIGCGTGVFLQNQQDTCHGFGLDFSTEALEFCTARGLSRIIRGDAVSLPWPDNTFDIVTAFDLIEHVRDDTALVKEIRRVLKPGGSLLATVPAYPLLWTGHDVSLHHFRRYRRRTFELLFDHNHWDSVRMTSGFFMIFPLAACIRLCKTVFRPDHPPSSDIFSVPSWLNTLLCHIHGLEATWLRKFNLPIGTSFMTVRRKKS